MRLPVLLLSLVFASAAVAESTRSEADLQRDQREQPEAVLAFAGIEPGMRVADVFGGAGYYSELLQHAVGEQGHVLLVNNPPYAAFAREGLAKRFADGRLPQIERREAPTDDLGLGEAQFDALVMVMAFHDVYWVSPKEGWPAIDTDRFIAQLQAALKPGGVLLIVDHAAAAGSALAAIDLHRIDPDFVREQLSARGLAFEAELDVLRNPQDTHTENVFKEGLRGRTDRFIHRYRKAVQD